MDTSLLSQPGLFTHPGFIGGMIGAFLGIIGGLFGASRSYRNAKSRTEQRWIIFYTLTMLLTCAGFVWALLAVQTTQRMYYQIGFHILFWPIGMTAILHLNRLYRLGDAHDTKESEQDASSNH